MFSEFCRHCTNNILVYYSVIRKEERTKNLADFEKAAQDVSFIRHILEQLELLTGSSILMNWFPTPIRNVMELLCTSKPVEEDLGGLLGLLMFAGIDFDDKEFFRVDIIKKSSKGDFDQDYKWLVDSHQNLATFLFGITIDDVSEMCWAQTLSFLLTTVYYRERVF